MPSWTWRVKRGGLFSRGTRQRLHQEVKIKELSLGLVIVDMTNIMTYNKTMISLNINEIKAHFSSCLQKVSNGETVIVCKRNVPIAEIKPIAAHPTKKRPIGLAGKEYPDFEISTSFFEPLPDDIVAAFHGEDS